MGRRVPYSGWVFPLPFHPSGSCPHGHPESVSHDDFEPVKLTMIMNHYDMWFRVRASRLPDHTRKLALRFLQVSWFWLLPVSCRNSHNCPLSRVCMLQASSLHWHPKWEMDPNDLWVSFLWEQRGVSQVDSERLSSFCSFYGIKIYTYLSGLLFYSIKIPYFTLLFSQSWPKWSSVPSPCKLWHDDTMHDSAGELVLPWGVGTCLTLPQSDNCALWQISDSVHSFYSW